MEKTKVKVKSAKVAGKTTKVVDEKNLDNAKKRITKEKDLMYQYPKDASTLEERKKFRTGARRKLSSFHKSIKKAKQDEKPELISAANDWAKKIYTPEHMPKF